VAPESHATPAGVAAPYDTACHAEGAAGGWRQRANGIDPKKGRWTTR